MNAKYAKIWPFYEQCDQATSPKLPIDSIYQTYKTVSTKDLEATKTRKTLQIHTLALHIPPKLDDLYCVILEHLIPTSVRGRWNH
jgi:hypothetical protein